MRHSTTTKHFRFVIEGEEMRNVYTFAGLTFALALALSLTTAAQTSSTESKQKASPNQRQTDSAGNLHRDRVGERLEWLSQQLNLTEDPLRRHGCLSPGTSTTYNGAGPFISDSTSRNGDAVAKKTAISFSSPSFPDVRKQERAKPAAVIDGGA